VRIIGATGGSPQATPHLCVPGLDPPPERYGPPEDPLLGVARHVHATRLLKARYPELICVGTGYGHLGLYLPHVAQGVLERRWTDLVGLGRIAETAPEVLETLVGA
jgi:hypothetical protein